MSRPVSKGEMKRVEQAVSAAVTDAFAEARKGQTLHRLGTALSLLHLLRAGKLEALDPGARDVLGMRRAHLQRVVDLSARERDVTRALELARGRGLIEGLGSDYRRRIGAYADYLLGDGFHNVICGLSEEAQGARLREELGRLAALDLRLAERTAAKLIASRVTRSPEGVIRRMSASQCADAADKVLCLLGRLPQDQPVDVVGNAKKGLKAAGTGSKLAELARNNRARRAVAAALGRAMTHRSYYATVSDEGRATALIGDLRRAGNEDAAQIVEEIRAGTSWARGIVAFSSLVAVAGIVAAFPPVDEQGNVDWAALGSLTGGAFSVGGSLPTVSRFLGKDLTPLVAKLLGAELQTSRAVAAGASLSNAANAGRFARACKVLGPVGDAIAVIINISTAWSEAKNEDDVGKWAAIVGAGAGVLGLTAGIAALCTSTGVGAPLAAVAAVIGLTAAAAEWFFTESALTGELRQHLRYLGIADDEERVADGVAVHRCAQRGRSHERPANVAEIVDRAASADVYEKVHLINYYMDGYTSGRAEDAICAVLCSTPYDGGAFVDLVQKVDTQRLAGELEDDARCEAVLSRISLAYKQAGRGPDDAFRGYVTALARAHRGRVLETWLDRGDHHVYQQVEPAVIKGWTELLMDGATGAQAERAVHALLASASAEQFNAIFHLGRAAYARRLRDEVMRDHWMNIHMMMQDPARSTHAVRHMALEVR